MRMIKKEQYSTPNVEVLVLLTEGVVCQSLTGGTPGNPGEPGGTIIPDDIFNGGII